MREKWQELAGKFDLLSPRERVMVAVATWVVIGMFCYLPIESLLLSHQKLTQQNSSLEQSNQGARELVELYHQRLAQNPNDEYRARLKSLEAQDGELDKQLSFQMVDMVPANYMPTLLSELLEKSQDVTLKGFSSIPPVALLDVSDDKKMNLYTHGLKIELLGDYFSVLQFIELIEQMPNKLYWKKMEYKVEQYPNASVQLELYTLSINKDFISVSSQKH